MSDAGEMDDAKASKDASRLLMSLQQAQSHAESLALVMGYFRSFYEAGYSCACEHHREGMFK